MMWADAPDVQVLKVMTLQEEPLNPWAIANCSKKRVVLKCSDEDICEDYIREQLRVQQGAPMYHEVIRKEQFGNDIYELDYLTVVYYN